MSCTDDPAVVSVAYGGTADRIGHSAHRLRVPTLGDRLRAPSPQSRVVTLSMKPRSTVMLAGHGGTAVTWFGDSNAWATSTAYAAGPVPEVAAYVAANPVERDRSDDLDARPGRRPSTRRRTRARSSGRGRPGRRSFRIRWPAARQRRRTSSTTCGSAARTRTRISAPWRRRMVQAVQARPARRRRLPRRQLLGARLRRPRLRSRQPGSPGRADSTRPHARTLFATLDTHGWPRPVRRRPVGRPRRREDSRRHGEPRASTRDASSTREVRKVGESGDGGRARARTARRARRVHQPLPDRRGARARRRRSGVHRAAHRCRVGKMPGVLRVFPSRGLETQAIEQPIRSSAPPR